MNKIEEAVALYRKGFLCSQAILSTYGPQFGLDKETALKIAQPFGGGISRLGEICGAVSGAIMVIGLKYGVPDVADKAGKQNTYDMTRKFVELFKERNDSIKCADLLGCNIGEKEGYEQAVSQNLFLERCPEFVYDAAEILENILK